MPDGALLQSKHREDPPRIAALVSCVSKMHKGTAGLWLHSERFTLWLARTCEKVRTWSIEYAPSAHAAPCVLQAARKGFKKVVCFESSPVNYEATRAAVKENNVSLQSPLSPFVTAGKH